jgi:hypothetical protein
MTLFGSLGIFGDGFCWPTDAKIENAGDHDHRPQATSTLRHGEAKGFGTLGKDGAA